MVPNPVKKKIAEKFGEQLKLRETCSNSPKQNETIRQFDFRRWNALEKSAPYTVLHGHCLRNVDLPKSLTLLFKQTRSGR